MGCRNVHKVAWHPAQQWLLCAPAACAGVHAVLDGPCCSLVCYLLVIGVAWCTMWQQAETEHVQWTKVTTVELPNRLTGLHGVQYTQAHAQQQTDVVCRL